jgi:hypothetical protein
MLVLFVDLTRLYATPGLGRGAYNAWYGMLFMQLEDIAEKNVRFVKMDPSVYLHFFS